MKNAQAKLFHRVIGTLLACCIPLTGCSADKTNDQPQPVAAAPAGSGFTVYAAGDIADCGKGIPADSNAAKTAKLVAARLASEKDAAVLTLGDNTYPSGRPPEFSDCYDPTWGQFKARTFPSPGNHDYYTEGAVGYYGYFGDLAGPSRRGYYSVDLGKWHIVSLNSNLKAKDHQAQIVWLKADLAAHPAACTLAYWHHPLFSSGGHGNNAQMKDVWNVLLEGNADVVLTGHDHDYERFAPQDSDGLRDDLHGIREFVVGTGGARLTMVGKTLNSEVSTNASHGVLKLVLKDAGYEWEFLPVADGAAGTAGTYDAADRGTGTCH